MLPTSTFARSQAPTASWKWKPRPAHAPERLSSQRRASSLPSRTPAAGGRAVRPAASSAAPRPSDRCPLAGSPRLLARSPGTLPALQRRVTMRLSYHRGSLGEWCWEFADEVSARSPAPFRSAPHMLRTTTRRLARPPSAGCNCSVTSATTHRSPPRWLWSGAPQNHRRKSLVRWETTILGTRYSLSRSRSAIRLVPCRRVAASGGSTTVAFLGVELHLDPDERDATRYGELPHSQPRERLDVEVANLGGRRGRGATVGGSGGGDRWPGSRRGAECATPASPSPPRGRRGRPRQRGPVKRSPPRCAAAPGLCGRVVAPAPADPPRGSAVRRDRRVGPVGLGARTPRRP